MRAYLVRLPLWIAIGLAIGLALGKGLSLLPTVAIVALALLLIVLEAARWHQRRR
jgi:hypothetical protein